MGYAALRRGLVGAVLGFTAGVAFTGAAQAGEPVELLAVTSSNPFNFVAALDDPNAGGPVDLEAQLVFPEGSGEDELLPAMIFVHGAGGPQAHHQTWLSLFRDLGIATVYADHFAPRGKDSAVGSHIQLTGAAMTADALNMLKALAEHPRIDPERIGIMGASKGGGVALYSAWNPMRRQIAGALDFAVHIPLYPTCVYWDEKDFTEAPVQVLVGGEDDWTGLEHCVASVEEFKAAGYANVGIRIYDGAPHGFDSGVDLRTIGHAYTVASCRFSIGADGRDYASGIYMENGEAKRAGLRDCAGKGATYGGDAAALEAAKADVRALLTETLLR